MCENDPHFRKCVQELTLLLNQFADSPEQQDRYLQKLAELINSFRSQIKVGNLQKYIEEILRLNASIDYFSLKGNNFK